MSIPNKNGCYCKKCCISVDPKDEKCPNGHILKEVGKHFVVVAKEKMGLSAEIGDEHELPSPIPLTFTNYDLFTLKTSTLKKPVLNEYHQTTKYRLNITEYCLNLLLKNYDNSIAFAAGLTGFLVQAKSALDSLSEEINIYYSLGISNPPWVTDIEKITKKQNISKLSTNNPNLAQILAQATKESWFSEFKLFRDQEGVHRKRSPRHMTIGRSAHDIQIDGKRVAEYCVNILYKINEIIEDCYDSINKQSNSVKKGED